MKEILKNSSLLWKFCYNHAVQYSWVTSDKVFVLILHRERMIIKRFTTEFDPKYVNPFSRT